MQKVGIRGIAAVILIGAFGILPASSSVRAMHLGHQTTVSVDTQTMSVPAGTPAFTNFTPPPPYDTYSAGEPSIGSNWTSGKVMYQASLTTFQVSFNDKTSPATATWHDVSSIYTSLASLDPILFTDPYAGRTFVSQLTGQDSLSAFTDNDGGVNGTGATDWLPSQGGGIPSGVDHQTIGSGRYSTALPLGPVTSYPNAVYYCSQDVGAAFCARSDDGGLTYGAGVPIFTVKDCLGLHGHVKVSPADGSVYVPDKNCNITAALAGTGNADQAVSVSRDDGLTWTVYHVPNSGPGGKNIVGDTNRVDPSVSIGSDGTVYFAYQKDYYQAVPGKSDKFLYSEPHVAVSHNDGRTWSSDVNVGTSLRIKNVVFPATTAGDGDRASFSFLGTPTAGDYEANGLGNYATSNNGGPQYFDGVWHLYVATTYNRGATWTTVDATPHDPVQRGSICTGGTTCGSDRNLLDFTGMATDKQGRVLVGYDDGCVGPCETATTNASHPHQNDLNSNTSYPVIARQSGGKGLFAAYDPPPGKKNPTPKAPDAPALNARFVPDSNKVSLTWGQPNDNGSPITSYRIYRGTHRNGETFLVQVPGSQHSYLDPVPSPKNSYYYYITAQNAAGTSRRSNEAKAQPPKTA